MKTDIRKIVVLGAGTMGAQVAAHAAGQGLEVVLLDLTSPAPDRSALARKAIEALKKLRPSPLHLPEHATLVRPGNFEDDWSSVADADWVFEAVVEDVEVKRRLFARVAAAVKPHAIVTSNTSGLGIAAMTSHLPPEFRRRFLGTHFFNPPRYLKLLETIPGPETDPGVVDAISAFCDEELGKGVVRAKDTPGFIANRVGAYAFGQAIRSMQELDLTVEEVDTLTGPAIGRAKSATFRTADIAGVDVCVKVWTNLEGAVPGDPEREVFRVPDFMRTMVERGWLGEKKGIGFYRKDGPQILALDWKTLEHRERRKAKFASVEAAQAVEDVGARLRQILGGKDKGAQFLDRVLSSTCLYAASLVPEISDDVVAVDRAMEWGYAWGQGPFRLLDALGVATVAERARAAGRQVPPLVEALRAKGRDRFYETTDGKTTVFGPSGVLPLPDRPGVLDLATVKARGGLRKKNAGASLVDLGDGCALVEFHSKMNALGSDAIGMLATAAKEARAQFDALVIGNQGEHFSAGANLMLILLGAQEEEWDELDLTIRQFQAATMALKYASVPVVAAPFGMTLGGGCEVCLHSARVRASAETYMGLVELGVGLVPAGGGTKELALRAVDRAAGVEGADPFPFLRRAFELIAFAKVSTSGAEAHRMFLTPADSLSANPDRLIADAKQVALGLARAGHRAGRPRTDVPALGRPALATFRMMIHNGRRSGQVSEHDALLATKVATILCGGDRPPGLASEQDFLDLEREAFLSLLGTPKTRERIQHMLKHGRPLRN
jgi:3-hydroxyacyl-CoA dehydrogenase